MKCVLTSFPFSFLLLYHYGYFAFTIYSCPLYSPLQASGVHRFRCILTLSGESQNCVVHIKNCTRRVRERAEQSWVALYFDRWTDIAARPEVVLGQTRYVLRRVTCDDDPVRHSVKW
jgi:hypothetical protein